jgi:hypothetical protein
VFPVTLTYIKDELRQAQNNFNSDNTSKHNKHENILLTQQRGLGTNKKSRAKKTFYIQFKVLFITCG